MFAQYTDPQVVQRTRQSFIDSYRECMSLAKSGELDVNDLADFIAWQESKIASMRAGESDHTWAFQARAHYLVTGESLALLGGHNVR